MRDTPEVSLGRQEKSPPATLETPTVDLKRCPGTSTPHRLDVPPTGDQHAPAFSIDPALPATLQSAVPPALADHPRYRVLEVLGEGGMGIVYKAEHRVMKRAVALKVIAAHLVAHPEAVARFRREVEAAARLSHPNIVTAYDAEQAGDCHFLVMELVDGMSLDRVLQRMGPLPVAYTCDFVRQAALGLQHAHEHGMVHRDIKPHNLMLTRQGQVKVLDFGLARFASENGPAASLTECGALTGTPDFMSPEQAEDARRADIRSDIYSLGCTLYTLLTGRVPFPGTNFVETVVGHLKNEPSPLTEFRSDLPPELVQVVGRMMAKDPVQRYQTPAEVARALLAFSKEGTITGNAFPADIDEDSVRSGTPHSEPTPVAPDLFRGRDGIAVSPREAGVREVLAPGETVPTRRIRRRGRKPGRRGPALLLVAVAVGVVCLVALGGLLIVLLSRDGAGKVGPGPSALSPGQGAGGEGQVGVVSRAFHLQLAIRRGGEVVGTLSPSTNPQMMLPAGEYGVQVVGGAPELQGKTAHLSLARGEQKFVEVRLEGIFVLDSMPPGPPPVPPGWPGGPPPGPPPGAPRP